MTPRLAVGAALLYLLGVSPTFAQPTWNLVTPATRPSLRYGAGIAYDPVHRQTVLFGGIALVGSLNQLVNETWLFDGVAKTWTQVIPAHSPSARGRMGMVYDAAHGQVVLFGGTTNGSGAAQYSNETWTWDGTDWTKQSPTTLPPGRYDTSLAYDEARQAVVLFGGTNASATLSDTWTWDGSNWTAHFPAHRPADRDNPRLFYDAALQRVILYGGANGNIGVGTFGILSDTWGWDGTDWTQLSSTGPLVLSPGIIFDKVAQRGFLFGGLDTVGNSSADSWNWNGATSTWTQIFPPSNSPANNEPALAYDSSLQRAVLFGGYGTSSALNDTWIYGSTYDWTQASPSTSPTGRSIGAMAWDGQKIIMFGGRSDTGFLNETWAWDGAKWTLLTPLHSPPARQNITMAYDSVRSQIVLFGGTGLGGPIGTLDLGDTWLWNGSDWQNPTPANSPPARFNGRLAFDTLHQEVVLYSGRSQTGINYSDVWTWDGTNWTQRTPAHAFPGRTLSPMTAWDPVGQQVLYYGGIINGAFQSDMWSWKNYDFSQLSVTTPGLRADTSNIFVTDTTRQLAFLYGGAGCGAVCNDTWTWDGTAWTKQTPSLTPGPKVSSYIGRQGQMMAYDPVHQQVVLFGGSDAFSTNLSDTWLYGPVSTNTALTITVPAGVQFTFNNQTYTGSQTIKVAPGSYTLSTNSPQAIATGTQAVFQSWSDAGAQSHSVVVGSSPISITGVFKTQYLMTATASPSNGGTVSQQSAASFGPYYDSGTLVSVFQTPNPGFNFTGWTGSCSGTGACFVTLNAPATVTANYARPTYLLTISVPAGVQYTLLGFPFTGTQTIALGPGSYPLSVNPVIPTGPGTQLAFVSWSDGGAAAHNVVLGAAPMTVTGTFKTQYQLTTASTPANQGTVNAGASYFDAGSSAFITALPTAAYEFEYWSGSCSGSSPVCLLVMNAPASVTGHFSVPVVSSQLYPAAHPSPRSGFGLAYDAVNQQVVLFGGSDKASQPLSDTWTWDGVQWTQQFPPVSPPARSDMSMAYHSGTGTVVMFGGETPGPAATPNHFGDTWVWDGSSKTWTQKGAGPSARFGSAMSAFGTDVILFGGVFANIAAFVVNNGIAYNDTWLWNGSVWTQRSPVHSPAPRFGSQLAYDSVRNQAVLNSGTVPLNLGGNIFTDTWVWNGTDWKAVSTSAPLGFDAAFDPGIQQVILLGSGNLWSWDGAAWSQKETTSGVLRKIVYDSARQELLAVGSDGSTWIRIAPKLNLAVGGSPTITKASNGDYLVTIPLRNLGNLAATALSATSATLAGTPAISIISPLFVTIDPALTTSIVARFPAAVGSGRKVISVSGYYSAPPVVNAAPWSVTLAVTLP